MDKMQISTKLAGFLSLISKNEGKRTGARKKSASERYNVSKFAAFFAQIAITKTFTKSHL